MSMRASFNVFNHVILPDAFLVIVLACDAPMLWRIASFFLFTYRTLAGLSSTTGDILTDYDLGILFALQWFTAAHLLLVVRPLHDFRHRLDVLHPTQYKFWYRVYWCACACVSVRGVGWSFQLKNLFASSALPRGEFVRSRLLRVVYYLLLFDLAQTYMSFHPTIFSYSATESVASHGYWYRCLNIFIPALNPYCGLSFPYHLVAAIHVGLGLSEPTDWPDPYGSIKEAYTIRRFWSKFWHQFMSRSVITCGQTASRVLGFRRHSRMAYLTALLIGFCVSGIIHVGGDVAAGRQFIGNSFPFFAYQAVGVASEQAIVQTCQRFGIKGLGRYWVVGYIWVAFWFSMSAVTFVDWGIRVGFFYKDALPISPARMIIHSLIPLYHDINK